MGLSTSGTRTLKTWCESWDQLEALFTLLNGMRAEACLSVVATMDRHQHGTTESTETEKYHKAANPSRYIEGIVLSWSCAWSTGRRY